MTTHAARVPPLPSPATHYGASSAPSHSHSPPSPAPAARKRRPHTRTSTGCRECRRQRIKCAEGPVSSSGRKVVCRRCWETDKQCHYPVGGRLQRGKGASEDMWEAAEYVQQWPGSAALEAAREEWTRLAETWLQAQVTNRALVEGRMKVDITPKGFGVAAQPKRRRAKHVDVGSILDPPAPLPTTAAVGFGAPEILLPVPPPPFSPEAGWVAFELPPLSESPGSDTSSSAAHVVFPPDSSAVFPPNDDGALESVFVPLDDAVLVAPDAALAPLEPVAIVPLDNNASAPLGLAPAHATAAATTASSDTGAVGASSASAGDDDILDLTAIPSESLQLAVRNSIIAESTSPGLGQSDLSSLLETLVNPAPASALSTFSIAGLSDCPLNRSAVSYFETQGCIEIVATSKMSHNWIYTQLFPRALASLCSPKPLSAAGKPTVHTYIRDYLHSSLLHLSFVHRGNLESGADKSWFWRCEAARSKKEADSAILKAKVLFNGPQWKTQEYL